MTDTIRLRVVELLKTRPDLLPQAVFGERIGRGGAWVSAFLSGTRPATDIDLVVRIAKVLGVPVAYLIGEERHAPPPKAMAAHALVDSLTDEGLETLLVVGRTLPTKATRPRSEASDAAPRAARASNSTSKRPR